MCRDCNHFVLGGLDGHRCQARLAKAARGFEVSRPTWMTEASPPEELLTRVRAFVNDRIDWGWRVVIEEGRIIRQIQVEDPDLPPPHLQVRELDHHEDWETAFRDLGLLR